MRNLFIFIVLFFLSNFTFAQNQQDSLYTFLKKYDYTTIDRYVSTLPVKKTLSEQTKLIVKPYKQDFEKVRAIYVWITWFVNYDNTLKFDSAEETFLNKKGTCAGFSKLFESMCKIAGINAEYIQGYARGEGNGNSIILNRNMFHAWNTVEINNTKFLIETTWASYLNKREIYYLMEPKFAISSHLPEIQEYQMLVDPVSKEYFQNPAGYFRKTKMKPIIKPLYNLL